MELRLSLCSTRGRQIAVINDRLDLVSSLLEQEINDLSAHNNLADIAEAEWSLLECKALLNKLTKAR